MFRRNVERRRDESRTHFMRGSSELVISAEQARHRKLSVTKLTLPIFGNRARMKVKCDPRHDKQR